jgi:molecular chaperone DnaK
MEYGLGIDVGTTFTAAAVQIEGRVDVARLGASRPEIPSLVFVGADGGILLGEAADRRGAGEPSRLIRGSKRRVGDPIPILVGGAPFSAHALIAHLLRHVTETVVSQQHGDAPRAITVTYPANWGPYKKELLDQALRMAEIDGAVLQPEPEAAAVQYAASEQVQPDEIVAVYDLGGGTFDTAILRKTATGFEVLGQPEGIEQLGGIDFDEAVFNHVLENLGDAVGQLDPSDEAVTEGIARLRLDCVAAKEALSFDTEIIIPVALPGLHSRVRLNRSEFEAMIMPALAETMAAVRRAFRSAGIAPTDLKSVLLAGGSSRIPLVGQLLADELNRPVLLDPHPEHTIALGAALSTAPAPAAIAAAPVRPPTPSVLDLFETEGDVPQPDEPAPVRPRRPNAVVSWLASVPRRTAVVAGVVAALAVSGLSVVLAAYASDDQTPPTPSASIPSIVIVSESPSPSPSSPEPSSSSASSGPPNRTVQRVRVPDLRGLSESNARQQLERLGLRARTVKETNNNRTAGTVIRTDPTAGFLANPGATVVLFVAQQGPSSPNTPTVTVDRPPSPPGTVSPRP